jgi:outer membrane protein
MRVHAPLLVWLLSLAAGPGAAWAQAPLPLDEAIRRAQANSPTIRSVRLQESEAAERVGQATAAYLPRIDGQFAWQRGDQPVFVFSSLLSQRRFTAANFAIDALNHPDPVNNLRTAAMAQQLVFDGGATPSRVAQARLGQQAVALSRTATEQQLAVHVTMAYGAALAAGAGRRAAESAVEAAEDDLRRTRDRRDAGLVTEADVLSVDVHLARVREQVIRSTADERIALNQLNELLGEPLDTPHVLDPAPPPVPGPEALEEDQAVASRPDVRLADVQRSLADATYRAERAAWLPHVSLQGGYELNGANLGDSVGSWIVGAEVRLNLFNGLGDRARLAESRLAQQRRATERESARTAALLDIRAARARVEAARARVEIGRTVVAQARESERIVRDRYEAGMADVTALLRAAEALLGAEAQEIGARVDLLIESAQLQRALGR